jgi:hypothetical protein
MTQVETDRFKVASTLNTDHASGTALRIFPKAVYAHSIPGEHELFTIMPPRTRNGTVDRDGFLIMMPENTVGRIPLEARNNKKNWTPPRQRRNPGQIPFRDQFIQEFPVKSFGARNKRWHEASIRGNLLRIEDLYVGIYPDRELSSERSEWPSDDEVQTVMRRERRSSRRTTISERSRTEGVEPLDYLTGNVERYLAAQGYDPDSGQSPSALALAIAIKAKIDGADEPEEGAEGLAQINDDWLDDTDLVRLTRTDSGPGHVAIGTQKTWNARRGVWEYMITGHLSYDVLDVVGREKPYVHPFGLEGKNRRADAALQLVDDNARRQNHLLSGHPKNPLLTPKPIMRFSFRTEEWGLKPGEITEHRPRIITPYEVADADDGTLMIPEVRTYLRTGELPLAAFVARRRNYAPPSDTRASKPRPEGLKTYRSQGPDDAGRYDVPDGLTLDDVIDEAGIDQIVSGSIHQRPLVEIAPPVADSDGADAEIDATAPAPASARSDEPTQDAFDPARITDFESLEAYVRAKTAETETGTHEANPDRESEPKPQNDPSPEQAEPSPDAAAAPAEAPADLPSDQSAGLPPAPARRPIIQKQIGTGGRVQFGLRGDAMPAKPPEPYPGKRLLKVFDALLAQRQDQMRHVAAHSTDHRRIAEFAAKTHWLGLALIETQDDASEVPEAQTIRDVFARMALAGTANPSGYAQHWLKSIQTLRDMLAPHLR